MLLKSIIAGIAVFLGGLFGCSKSAAPPAVVSSTTPVAQSKIKDLGILPMTNNNETCVSFGAGRDCRIVPKVLDRNNVQLTLTLESKDADGRTSSLSIVQVVGSQRKPFDISFGGTDFTFTPQIAAE